MTYLQFTQQASGQSDIVWYATKSSLFLWKRISALPEYACQINYTIGWDNYEIITTNRRYHRCLCLETWHINSAHLPLNRDDGGLLPDSYLLLIMGIMVLTQISRSRFKKSRISPLILHISMFWAIYGMYDPL